MALQPRESVDPENLAQRRAEALEAVQKLEEEVISCKLTMADRIEGRIAAEARAADYAIDADVAKLKYASILTLMLCIHARDMMLCWPKGRYAVDV